MLMTAPFRSRLHQIAPWCAIWHKRPPLLRGVQRYCRAYLSWLLAFFGGLSSAFAQYQIDSWTTENGLPQNVIQGVCQAPNGYLWLAAMDGLVRFDGVRFTVFNRSNTLGIAGNRFTSLYCTQSEEFWAGTETSGITRYRQGRFTTYTTQHGLPSNDVSGVAGDGTGRIWAVSGSSVVQWNEAGSRFNILASEQGKYSETSQFGRFGFWGINGDQVRLFVLGQVLQYSLPQNWPRGCLTTVGWDLNGGVWLASADGRFAKLSGGRWSRIVRRGAKPDSLTTTYRDSHGNLWNIGIGSDSVASLHQYLILPSESQTQKIVFNSLFEDREGSLWLPTDGQGLYRIRKEAVSVFSREEGLPARNVYPIYQDRSGAIWIGTWDGGLARFEGGKFITFSAADGLISNRIMSIFEDRDGALWVATAAGLERRRHGRFELVRNQLLRGGEGVRAIYQDGQGTLWFGTSRGLIRCQGGLWSVISSKDGLATDDVRVIIAGRTGNLWLGGYGGLTSLDNGLFRRWTEADGLPSNSIRALYEDADGVLWIGTYDGGLGRLQNGRLTRYAIRDGLFNNGVFQILEDARGYLWMSSNRGIYRVAKSELNDFAAGERHTISSVAYGKGEGLHNAECNGGLWPAGILSRDGKLWFPTQDGVAIIDPARVELNLRPPPVAIASILLDYEPAGVGKAVRITPGKENLEIDYTALSLIKSDQIRFQYKLEGLDRDWVEAGTRRTAYYSHLPSGNYVFKVIAANSDGVWNLEGQSVPVVVLPHFYQARWFLALASLLMAAMGGLAWERRVARLKRASAMQRAFSRELIASQERERKRIAAELHDSLGQHLVVIKNLALISLKNGLGEGRARAQIDEISAEASQALSEVREISYNLRPYQLDRLGLTKAIEAIVKKASCASSIVFAAEIAAIDGLFPKDSEIHFYRIVQEWVNNLVKHSQATEARVAVRRAAGGLVLTIRDNGRGFTPEAVASDRTAGGFGLIGLSERAQLLGGKLAIQSAPGQGAMINIDIPIANHQHGERDTHRDRG